MVNQYSANRRNLNFCCNTPRNQLAATASEHNQQYTGYPRNIQSSNHRRNRLSKSNFKHYMTSQQPYFIPSRADRFNGQRITWQDRSTRLNHYGRGRFINEQNSQLDTRVVLEEWNTNPNFAQTNFNNSDWNRNYYYNRQHNRNNKRNRYSVQQPKIRSHANLNNNRNRQHKNFHNCMEVAVSKDDETEFDITHGNRYWCNQPLENNDTEEDLAESCQISSDRSPGPSPTYAHGNWKWLNVESNNDPEENLTTNSHISDGSLNHVRTNCKSQDQSHDCCDSEKDLDVNSESSYTNCKQDIEITLQEESEQSEIEDDSILLPDNTLDEQTENTPPAENETSTIYVYKIMNPCNGTYRQYICLPLDEGNCVANRYQDNENLADDWIQDNAGEDGSQDAAGLAEEAISEQLQTRIHSKYANKGNWEADSLIDAEEPAVCVICQLHYEDAETLGSLQCGHEYHADCIRKWLVRKNNCPICKYTILVEDVT